MKAIPVKTTRKKVFTRFLCLLLLASSFTFVGFRRSVIMKIMPEPDYRQMLITEIAGQYAASSLRPSAVIAGTCCELKPGETFGSDVCVNHAGVTVFGWNADRNAMQINHLEVFPNGFNLYHVARITFGDAPAMVQQIAPKKGSRMGHGSLVSFQGLGLEQLGWLSNQDPPLELLNSRLPKFGRGQSLQTFYLDTKHLLALLKAKVALRYRLARNYSLTMALFLWLWVGSMAGQSTLSARRLRHQRIARLDTLARLRQRKKARIPKAEKTPDVLPSVSTVPGNYKGNRETRMGAYEASRPVLGSSPEIKEPDLSDINEKMSAETSEVVITKATEIDSYFPYVKIASLLPVGVDPAMVKAIAVVLGLDNRFGPHYLPLSSIIDFARKKYWGPNGEKIHYSYQTARETIRYMFNEGILRRHNKQPEVCYSLVPNVDKGQSSNTQELIRLFVESARAYRLDH